MSDLQNARLIYLKGLLFLLSGVMSAGLLLIASPNFRTACLLSLTVWSFCRFYYFAFYVIGHYVDDGYHFAGLWDFVLYCLKKTPE